MGGSFMNMLMPAAPVSGRAGMDGCFYGVYVGLVTDEQDPEGLGRVRIRLPWLTDSDGDLFETWARVATMMAGANRGTWFIPEPDDEVLIAFQGGDPRHPIVTGSLWNGKDSPPESMDSNNNIRSITSRSGIKVTFDDTDGAVAFTVETPGGQVVKCEDTPATITVSDSSGNSIKMEASGVTITASSKLTMNASQVEITAGMVKVNAAMSQFSGIVQSDTNITNSTVSASYTPGAGNIW
jgi:uncharacterized protein involved in type VI secretion and phage assembly